MKKMLIALMLFFSVACNFPGEETYRTDESIRSDDNSTTLHPHPPLRN